MKKQGKIFFQDLDLNKYQYPAVLLRDGDTFTNEVTGPFENSEQLKVYIEKENLMKSHDYYEITQLHNP